MLAVLIRGIIPGLMFDCTPFLRAYSKFRLAQLAAQNPAATQEAQLMQLLQRAQNTKIGRDYEFAGISSVAEFQARVPLRRYEDFWEHYWQASFPRLDNLTWPGLIGYFCWTSGTTSGKRKFIPYTNEMARAYNKAGTDLLVQHLKNRPSSRLFGGKSFMLGGTTTAKEESPGVFVGEVSGFSAMHMPWWAKPFFFPPRELTDIADWMDRTDRIAAAARGTDVRLIGGMPSWLLIFLERFKGEFPDSEGLLTKLFPNLELLVHGGVRFDAYLKQYQHLMAGGHAELREIYPASEAFMAVADRGYGEGMRLALDAGVFYEFVPVEELESPGPTRHWIKNVELGVNYAIVLTTCAGVWSYILGDTVKFVDRNPGRILITGRTAYAMSAFGEHLILEEVDSGISAAADRVGVSVSDYAMGVTVTGRAGDLGRHVYVVECTTAVTDDPVVRDFRDKLDAVLLGLNDDYADHRGGGCGLNPPEVIFIAPGSFKDWMALRGKLGDQHKVPRIITDKELFGGLVSFCEQKGHVVGRVV